LICVAISCVFGAQPSARGAEGEYEPLPEMRAALERDVAAIAVDVAAVRGRPWKRPVALAFAAPASPEARLSGFYRWGSDTITLVDVRGLVRLPLVAHELVHALQDQYHDLGALDRGVRGGDAEMAVSAAIEGEAHAVAIAVVLRRAGLDGLLPPERWPPPRLPAVLGYRASHAFGLKPGPAARALPPVEEDAMLAPYIEGLAFAHAVMRARGRGFASLDDVLNDPPRSTAEVLHPDRYLLRRRGLASLDVPVPAPDAPGAGWRLASQGSVGEWRLRARLLAAGVPRAEARRASAGLTGDRRAVFVLGRERRVLWRTSWATEADAREAREATLRLPGAWTGAPRQAASGEWEVLIREYLP